MWGGVRNADMLWRIRSDILVKKWRHFTENELMCERKERELLQKRMNRLNKILA